MRRMIVTLLLAATLSAGGWAQESKENKPEPTNAAASKVFEVKPGNVERIVSVLRNLVGSGGVTSDAGAGVVVVRTEKDMMPAVEQLVKRLDVATVLPNVEMTFYVLLATAEAASGAVPAELQSTVTQLKNTFAFQGFEVLDTAVLRSRVGDWTTSDGALAFGKEHTAPYSLRFRPSIQADEKARSIRLDALTFEAFKLPTKPQGNSGHVKFGANIDAREGQKVVVGKSGIEGNQRALILVVTGKIVD